MEPEQVLREIELAAPKRGLPIIGPERGTVLDDAVRKHHPLRILEVGTLVGYSAIRMARLLPDNGLITCIEVNPDIAKEARSNIAAAGYSDKVKIVVGDAKNVISGLEGRFDMVFIDAKKEEYFLYLTKCEPLLHPGSVVLADNTKVFAAEMADYLNHVRNSGKYISHYMEAPSGADAVEVSVRL